MPLAPQPARGIVTTARRSSFAFTEGTYDADGVERHMREVGVAHAEEPPEPPERTTPSKTLPTPPAPVSNPQAGSEGSCLPLFLRERSDPITGRFAGNSL